MGCNLPGSSVHGILQERTFEWVAFLFPGDLPNPGIEPGSPTLQADSSPSCHLQKSDSFTLFLSIWILLIFFLILLLWLGHPVLYWIKVVRLEFLFPEFIRKTVNFSPLSILLAMGLPWMAFYMLKYVSLPLQWECLSWEDIKFYQMLFLCLLWLCVFVFSFVKVIYHIDLSILNQPCDPWINLTWSWCMVFLMYY